MKLPVKILVAVGLAVTNTVILCKIKKNLKPADATLNPT